MIKTLCFRFQQCFRPFTLLLVEGFSETELFRQLCNHVYPSPYYRKYMSYDGPLFFENFSKFNLDFKNGKKKSPEKVFCFWDNSI